MMLISPQKLYFKGENIKSQLKKNFRYPTLYNRKDWIISWCYQRREERRWGAEERGRIWEKDEEEGGQDCEEAVKF